MNKDYVYKRRLLSLADLLDKLPAKQFDYNHWVGSDWKGKSDLSCGTTACALGWATTIPALRRIGLRLLRDGFNKPYIGLKDGSLKYNEREYVAQKVFGLNEEEFEFLFIPGRSGLGRRATAKRVAKHIRTFVKEKYNRAKAQ